MADDAGGGPAVKQVSRPYIIILVTVIVLMFVCLALWVVLSLALKSPDSAQSSLIDGVSKVFTGCVGALLGLLGGKLA